MSVRPLFVYGTLRDPELRAAVLGRSVPAHQVAEASAPGWRTVFYPGRRYPAIIRVPGAVATGELLLDVTPFERDLLDAFEGHEYRRSLLPVITDSELHEADAYLPATAVPREAPVWRLADWQRDHKRAVLAADTEAADQLRARLIAIRPN